MPDIVSPIDGTVVHSYDHLEPDAALAALARAQAVQADWAQTSIVERVELCRKMLDAYRARLDDNAKQITMMMGKPLAQARGEFEGGTVERASYLCDIAQEALADHVLPNKPGFKRYIRHEPVGVVLDIAAWNYPLVIAINVIVPSVLAGNAVLIKHAHQTEGVGEQYAKAFAEAGAPEGLVQNFPVTHETAQDVLATRRIGYVSFTGSVRGGHEVARAVARDNFIGAGFELGGKDGALVLPDAPFEHTVETLVDGSYYNAGQSCCGIERIYVHADIYDRFVEAFAAKVHEYKLGNPLQDGVTLGPVVNEKAAGAIQHQVLAALDAGARSIVDASKFDVPNASRCYVPPSALINVDHSMEFMREETFGPTVGIMKFSDEEEGIRLMNDSQYGLTGSIWSADPQRAERIARDIEAGTVFLNRCDYLDPALAWTGVKDTGYGCSLSKYGFAQVTRLKSYHLRTEV